jgi:cytosine/adenosine deaminase-related metal-dependent hydrolase
MFPAMHFALQWARGQVHHANAHPAAGTPKTVKHNALSSASVFRMATLGGAHAAKRGAETGSIEPGKFADIVLYDADSIALGGVSDPFKGIALHATAEDVSWVFVSGRIVKKEGKLVDVEVRGEKWGWKNVVKELRERSDALHKRVEHIDQEERYNTMLKMFHVPVVE